MEEEKKFLIWNKERGGAWYRPNSAGYTVNPDLAGRYTEQEASNIHVGTHGDCVGYLQNSPFVSRKRNEYLAKKKQEIRSCMQTLLPEQALDILVELVKERMALDRENGI